MKILLTISFLILFIILGLIDRETMSEEELKKRIWLFNHGFY